MNEHHKYIVIVAVFVLALLAGYEIGKHPQWMVKLPSWLHIKGPAPHEPKPSANAIEPTDVLPQSVGANIFDPYHIVYNPQEEPIYQYDSVLVPQLL